MTGTFVQLAETGCWKEGDSKSLYHPPPDFGGVGSRHRRLGFLRRVGWLGKRCKRLLGGGVGPE
eukprot:765394-Hanusia_phi.AAC.1